MLVLVSVWNPSFAAVTSYRPTESDGALKRPASSVARLRSEPVSTFLILTAAPAIAAPVESATWPEMEASPCATADIANSALAAITIKLYEQQLSTYEAPTVRNFISILPHFSLTA